MLAETLESIYQAARPLNQGQVAHYIPELAKANPDWFGVVIVTTEGEVIQHGDAERLFTVQSLSKVLTYALALQDNGREKVFERVGVEPTGTSFNSIVLDEQGRPYNPMVNAGALVVANLIQGVDSTERLTRILDVFRRATGHDVHLDGPVFTSERLTGHRNRAIAHLLRASGMLTGPIDDIVDLYFQHCSLLVSALDLATIAATLANRGVNPLTAEQAIERQYLPDLLSVMYTCGMYDSSGEWAYRVGLPAKSGISGGLMAVVPGRMGIGIFSPPLNRNGHSVRGLKVCEDLSRKLCLHSFADCDEA